MAPNVKQLFLLSQQLQDLEIVQPKFLPLTDPREQEQRDELEQQWSSKESSEHGELSSADTCSYWDWPAEEVDEPSPVEDEFSASCIEANLIAEANKLRVKTNKKAVDIREDSCWDEMVEAELDSSVDNDFDSESKAKSVTVPQHEVSYWDWPVDTKKVMIDSILQDEMARVQVSSESIQRRLVIEKIRRMKENDETQQPDPAHDAYWAWKSPVVSPTSLDASHPNFSYWDWMCDSGCESNGDHLEKTKLLEKILQEEKLRIMLSIENVERTEQRSCAKEIVSCRSSTDDYWTFDAKEDEGGHYWEWDTTTDSESYWVM